MEAPEVRVKRIRDILYRLETIVSDDSLPVQDDGLRYYPNPEDLGNAEAEELLNELDGLCWSTVLMKNGFPNPLNRTMLLKLGVNTFPGDHDSFGWITGAVELKDRVYVFG